VIAYQFYLRDEKGKTRFIGILTERRKAPDRVTPESILNWGRKVIGERSNLNDIYFVQVEL
jgi:hypothetical protein